MKNTLIALGVLALSSTAALARDVNSTAPDTGDLGHPTVQSQTAGDYQFKPASARNVYAGEQAIVNGGQSTAPDLD